MTIPAIIDPSVEPPDPPSSVPARGPRIVCEFCQCSLTPAGDVLKMSDTARAFNKQGDTIDTLRDDLRQSQNDLAEALRERDEARAALPKPREGFRIDF